jgi:hydrogenase expression/formation protein HypC
MCLAIPGRVLRLLEETPEARWAEVDFSGERKTVNLLFLPEASVGDYVVVHAGFATHLVPEADALEAQAQYRRFQQAAAAATG